MARNKKPMDEFDLAESLGEIRTMPEQPEIKIEVKEEDPLIDDPQEFRIAIANAQFNDTDFVEVSERLFKHLLKNAKTNYFTYGDPGVKVYLAGTRLKHEKEDKMNAEDYAIMEGKRRQAELEGNV